MERGDTTTNDPPPQTRLAVPRAPGSVPAFAARCAATAFRHGVDRPRARAVAAIGLGLAVVSLALAATQAALGNLGEASGNLAAVGLMTAVALLLPAAGRHFAVIGAVVTVTFAAMVLMSGPRLHAVIAATATLPLLATLLRGVRAGTVWLGVVVVVDVGIGVAAATDWLPNALRRGSAQLLDAHTLFVLMTGSLFAVGALYEQLVARAPSEVAGADGEHARVRLEKPEERAEHPLASAERMASLGRIAAAAAHEVNNPLSYVTNNIEFALQQLDPNDARSELANALTEALDGVRRIQRIVADLKAYARPEDEATTTVDVRRALRKAVKIAEGHTRSKARVEWDFVRVPRVLGSESRLVQVFLNLLVNAAQALPEGHASQNRIVVRTRLANQRVEVEIEDTGSGVPEETLKRVGEPFFTTKSEGMGLGLAVCQSILGQIGGELQLESQPGRTIARVRLVPKRERPPSELSEQSSSSRWVLASRVAQVLVVDDEPLVARSIQRNLKGHQVRVARSGREALQILESSNQFDLVLCDVMMPELSGIDLYLEIRARYPQLLDRVVFMTGGTFTERAHAFRGSVANVFLEKPLDVGRLRELVALHTKDTAAPTEARAPS
jgi:signal transduction histidine kinase/ActR/RegA family two-component response regulator